MLKDRVQAESNRQTITLDRLHFQKWRPGITFIPASDCAINACLNGLHANRATLAEHNKRVRNRSTRRLETCTRVVITTTGHRTRLVHMIRMHRHHYRTHRMFTAPHPVIPAVRTLLLAAIPCLIARLRTVTSRRSR